MIPVDCKSESEQMKMSFTRRINIYPLLDAGKWDKVPALAAGSVPTLIQAHGCVSLQCLRQFEDKNRCARYETNYGETAGSCRMVKWKGGVVGTDGFA